MIRPLLTLSLTALLSACSSGAIKEAPSALPETRPNEAKLSIDWWHRLVEDNTELPLNRLAPRLTDEGILAASPLGDVWYLSKEGRIQWQRQLADQLTAPLASDEAHLVLTTGNGEVQLFDWAGNQQWSTQLNALATVAPLLLDDRVIIQTTDDRITALERNTGRTIWTFQDAQPRLSITGTAQPTLVGNTLVTGLANGKLVSLSVEDGRKGWEYRIARAQGKTDISRLVDVDASISLVNGLILAAGYQGDLLVIDAATGRVLASKPLSTYRSIIAGSEYWYAVDEQSHVLALNPQTLEVVWRQEQFTYRRLSKAVPWRDTLAFSDSEGYVHLLDSETGRWLSSKLVDWNGASTAPVLMGDFLLQQGNSARIKRLSMQRN